MQQLRKENSGRRSSEPTRNCRNVIQKWKKSSSKYSYSRRYTNKEKKTGILIIITRLPCLRITAVSLRYLKDCCNLRSPRCLLQQVILPLRISPKLLDRSPSRKDQGIIQKKYRAIQDYSRN